MTPDDALERDLESLRPRPPSPQLRRRIGARLGPPRHRLRWAALAVAAAAAAGVVIYVSRPVLPPGPIIGPPPVVAAEPDPTVRAYRLALAQSPEALEAALDRQAVRTSREGPPARTAAFTIPDLLAVRGPSE
ncbi:MAG TPA: hypothetical protein VGF55_00530 [Gemmataceae bacterium]|jgi:hypothetical protein